MATTVAVIDASIGDTPAERNFRRELAAETTVFKVSEGEFPPSATSPEWSYDGVVISGSQTSVYEDRPWIHRLTRWFRDTQAAAIPTLGVCWGHQFIAQALGGRVVAMDDYELGYATIIRHGPSPLFRDLPDEFIAFETHSDRVSELPPGAVPLASNANGLQAFQVGTAFGVQFHPEYDRQTAEWVTQSKDTVSQSRINAVLDTITENTVAEARTATSVFDRFLEYATTWDQQTAAELV